MLNEKEQIKEIADIRYQCYLTINPLKQKIEKFNELLTELELLKINFEKIKTKHSPVKITLAPSLFSKTISIRKLDELPASDDHILNLQQPALSP